MTDDCNTFNKTSRQITSPGYPETYPMERSCTWQIRIPTGTFLSIEEFEYTFDCLPREEGEGWPNTDEISTTGFAGGTTIATSKGTVFTKCSGIWEKTTSYQHNLEIKFRSDEVRDRQDGNANFKIQLSSLQGEKR